MVTEFTVRGMTCDNCVAHVTKAVQSLKGVQSVSVSLEDKRAVVDFDETLLTPDDIVEAIDEEGYEAQRAA